MNLNITDQEEGKFHSEDEYNLSSLSNITFNVSQETLGEPNPILAEVFESPPFKIVAVIVYLLLMLVGCVLLFLVIHFEQFGGDPQKRSIFNQMFAYLAATYRAFDNIGNRTYLLSKSTLWMSTPRIRNFLLVHCDLQSISVCFSISHYCNLQNCKDLQL